MEKLPLGYLPLLSSPSNHFMMKQQARPAATAIKKDSNNSM